MNGVDPDPDSTSKNTRSRIRNSVYHVEHSGGHLHIILNIHYTKSDYKQPEKLHIL